MNSKLANRISKLVFDRSDRFKLVAVVFIFTFMIFEYVLVYVTGGSQFSYTHIMYIPILLSGIIFGFRGGLFFGMLAGLLIGPLMPLDTVTGEQQQLFNWMFRFTMYTSIGSLSGFSFESFRKQSKEKLHYMTTHRGSGLKLAIFDGTEITEDTNWNLSKDDSVLAVCLMNFDKIVDLLGKNEYYNIFRKIHQKLVDLNGVDDSVLQQDIRSFIMYSKNNNGQELANKINELLSNSLDVNGTPIYIEANIGICFYNGDIEETIDKATLASRQAEMKHLDFAEFDFNQETKQSDFEILGTFLADFKNNQTRLVYHPIIDLKTNKVVSIEALSRWENEIKGEVSPNYFIPLVEDTQIINELTRWVFDTSVVFLKKLHDKGIMISISVNISANNLMSTKLIDYIIEQTKKCKVDTSYIVFEITETALMNNPMRSLELINVFKDLGISISLDDFGTGYSSLSYLSNFPLDKVKIDKSFIKDILTNQKVYDIVESSIRMSHKLGFATIAEGVEDIETENVLRELKCDYVQGFLYTKPLEEDQYEEWHNIKNKKL